MSSYLCDPSAALFKPEPRPGKGTVGGISMCNNSGSYCLDQDALKFDGIESIQIRCPENVMQADAAYLEMLVKTSKGILLQPNRVLASTGLLDTRLNTQG